MQRTLIGMFRVIPLPLMYGIMSLVIPFYIIFDGKARRASWQFHRKRMGENSFKAALSVYRSEFNLGMVVLDRFAMYAGKQFRMIQEETGPFNEVIGKEGGVITLSSHVGNYELAGYSMDASPRKMYALVFAGETATVMQGREKLFSRKSISMIPVSSDMSHIFTLNRVLSEGNIVSMPGDRIFGSPKAVEAPFMGEPAKFPKGPFALAAAREIPAFSVFVMKKGLKTYVIDFFRLDREEDRSLPRAGREKALAARYASSLEETVRKHPCQWYNFYDFWA